MPAFSLSESDLDKIEKEFVFQINQSSQVLRDPLEVEYINHLGRRLAKNTDLSHYSFFIVKSNEINAFAGPGGYIGINTSLILASSNESELAAVMAHELSHVALSHLSQMIAHQKQMTIPMIASTLAALALGLINPVVGQGALMATLSGFAQDSINFTRANEKQADRMGINLLYKAGFDPMGMVNFFKKMQQNDRYYYSDNIPAILRSHPLDEDRISEALNRISQLKKKKQTITANFFLFKERIRVVTTLNKLELLNYYKQLYKIKKHALTARYGMALTYLTLSNYQAANKILSKIVRVDEDNLYYQIPLAESELGLHKTTEALNRLNDMYQNYPDNYAAIIAYANLLVSAKQFKPAINLLSQSKMRFPNDVNLCNKLSRAYADNKQKGQAYFSHAQCLLLQGEKYAALNQLTLAAKYSRNNKLLMLQIKAKKKIISQY